MDGKVSKPNKLTNWKPNVLLMKFSKVFPKDIPNDSKEITSGAGKENSEAILKNYAKINMGGILNRIAWAMLKWVVQNNFQSNFFKKKYPKNSPRNFAKAVLDEIAQRISEGFSNFFQILTKYVAWEIFIEFLYATLKFSTYTFPEEFNEGISSRIFKEITVDIILYCWIAF